MTVGYLQSTISSLENAPQAAYSPCVVDFTGFELDFEDLASLRRGLG